MNHFVVSIRGDTRNYNGNACNVLVRPPLWASGQTSWLQTQRSRVPFPALTDFLSSSRSGKGSIQPREDK
jgi:hypothetical protein